MSTIGIKARQVRRVRAVNQAWLEVQQEMRCGLRQAPVQT